MSTYFYDLHIHSCLSPCADDDMTPNNIAGMAALKGLNLLALTDHNSCQNCPAFFEACRNQGIVPVAGMELTTAEDIHLVCLFEHLDQAMAFDAEIAKHRMPMKNRTEIFGNQWILDSEDELIGEEEILLIVSILGDIPEEYGFACFEFNDSTNIDPYMDRFSQIRQDAVLVCSDAHHLWDINEAENSMDLEDEPYSSALVRKKLFEYFNRFSDFHF